MVTFLSYHSFIFSALRWILFITSTTEEVSSAAAPTVTRLTLQLLWAMVQILPQVMKWVQFWQSFILFLFLLMMTATLGLDFWKIKESLGTHFGEKVCENK